MKGPITATVLFSVTLALLVACRDEKDDPHMALIGTWEEMSLEITDCIEEKYNASRFCDRSCQMITITQNSVSFDDDPPTGYTIDGNTITIVRGGLTLHPTFEVSGNILTITIQYNEAEGGCKSVYMYRKSI